MYYVMNYRCCILHILILPQGFLWLNYMLSSAIPYDTFSDGLTFTPQCITEVLCHALPCNTTHLSLVIPSIMTALYQSIKCIFATSNPASMASKCVCTHFNISGALTLWHDGWVCKDLMKLSERLWPNVCDTRPYASLCGGVRLGFMPLEICSRLDIGQ